MKIFSILCGTLLCISGFAQSSKKDQKATQYQEALQLINSNKYAFVAQRANPGRGGMIDLTTNPNFVRVNGDKAVGELPYFGRAFTGGYSGSDGGISFDGSFESYEVIKNDRKNRLNIKFKIKGKGDTYSLNFNVSSLENVSLNVISNNRQTINYYGYIQELEKAQ